LSHLSSPGAPIPRTILKDDGFNYYRLHIIDKSGKVTYSPVIRTTSDNLVLERVAPNPVRDKITMQITSSNENELGYEIYNLWGSRAIKGSFKVNAGQNTVVVPVQNLAPGIYQLFFTGAQPLSFRFVKH
jgi:hypothetical protein